MKEHDTHKGNAYFCCVCVAAEEIFSSLQLCFAFACFPFISFSCCGEMISQDAERQRGLGEPGGGLARFLKSD